MRVLPSCPRPRAALPALRLLTAFTLFGTAGCGSSASRPTPVVPAGKGSPPPPSAVAASSRRMSEYDFYCTLHPPRTVADPAAGPRPFAPTVYDAMKGQGYRVHLVRYRYERSADGFGRFSGYGFRDFFGGGPSTGAGGAGGTLRGQRSTVVWETRRGEFFLVDRYYAAPIWLEGVNWLEKMRFYDPAAVSVEVEKS